MSRLTQPNFVHRAAKNIDELYTGMSMYKEGGATGYMQGHEAWFDPVTETCTKPFFEILSRFGEEASEDAVIMRRVPNPNPNPNPT